MDLIIQHAKETDIENIAALVAKSWYKHEFFDLGYKYDRTCVIEKLHSYLDSSVHFVYIGLENKRIIGYLILVEIESVFSRQKMLVQIALQSDPELGKYKESRLIKSFMNFTDDFTNIGKYDLQCMTMSHKYDFTDHLLKRGYKLSDKIFTRKVK